MIELKPCPFCGKEDLFVGTDHEIDLDLLSGMFAVCCDFQNGGCGACSGYRDTKEEAIEAWNRRDGK